MQGKPPPSQAATGPQSSPAGMTPPPRQGPQTTGPTGGLMGMAPPAGADGKRRGRGGEGARLSDVRWAMIFKLGWKLLSYFKLLAVGYCLMMLVQNCVNLGSSQLLGEVTKALNSSVRGPAPAAETAPAPNTPAISATNANAPVVPKAPPKSRLILFSVLWAIFALAALAIGLPMRAISTKLDMALSNKLRSQLFARMLRQSPEFYHDHESGELNAVVNQFTVEASMTLRQVSVDMVLQVITLGITVGLLIYNFQMDGPPPTIFGVAIPPAAIPLAIVLFAFISPWITAKLSNKVRDVSRDMQEKMVALNSLVTGAMQSPEEIQAMEAEPMFVAKHDKQLFSLLKSRIKNTLTMEYMGLISGLPSWVVQVVLLAFGVYTAYRSGDAEAAGKVVAIFLLAPQLMGPIQALSVYLIMAGSAWPRIETVNEMMESKARREEKSGTVKVASVEPTLAAKNLTFAYTPASRKIFDDISFEIPPGKITGFVARMGQGKTTFFKLALRFYDPQQGQVILGGRPVGDYASDNLYNHIAMMSQFPAFFYDTLRANMQMAKQ
ncbi:MAG TPA: ABC transporter ATP-binding protein, partial [Chthoniobacterales bacterium]